MSRSIVQVPPPVRELLAAAGELLAGQGYLVGGSLRDLLLGRPLADLDLAVPGDAPAFARALADRLGGHFVLLDAERGVARVALDEGAVRQIDVAAIQDGSIEADLARRDFTIDALAAPLRPLAADGAAEIIDPHGGLRDLKSGEVRLVSDEALPADPLRLLRAVRLAAELDLRLAPQTAEAVRTHAGRIGEAAAERQRDELVRCLATPRAAQALRLTDELGLLELLLPEVTAGRGVEQPKEHYWDVFGHALQTVASLDVMVLAEPPLDRRAARLWQSLWETLAAWDGDAVASLRAYLAEEVSEGRARSTLLKLAGLLHDVAKPETRAPDESGRIRFLGHAERGAETARRIMQRLRFSRRETELVATMVEEHLRPTQLGPPGELPTRRALFRFFRDTGEAAEGILLLSLADALAARGPRMRLDAWRGHVAYVGHILVCRHMDEGIVRPHRLLSGDEIMAELGLEPGPEVGRLLSALEEAQGSGELSSREEALAFVRRLHHHAKGGSALTGVGTER
jgi:poly(A) polymerase